MSAAAIRGGIGECLKGGDVAGNSADVAPEAPARIRYAPGNLVAVAFVPRPPSAASDGEHLRLCNSDKLPLRNLAVGALKLFPAEHPPAIIAQQIAEDAIMFAGQLIQQGCERGGLAHIGLCDCVPNCGR